MILLTPFSQGTHLLSVGHLIVVGEISPITVVSSANLTMTLEMCVAVQSCVYRKYREWAEDAALWCTSVEDQGR